MKFSTAISSILALVASTSQAAQTRNLARRELGSESSESYSKSKGKGSSCKYFNGKGKGKGSSELDEIMSLGAIVEGTEALSTLALALETADLLEFFYCEAEDVTVFAPTNAAFEALGMDLVALLLTPGWTLHLQSTLLKHVVDGVIFSDVVADGAVVPTFLGEDITASVNGAICFNPGNACVATPDVMASNGIAHVVDNVILPDWASTSFGDVVTGNADFSILGDLLACSGLTLPDEITVFAPTNDAFNTLFDTTGLDVATLCGPQIDLLTAVLTYHLVPAVVPSVLLEEGVNKAPTLEGSMVMITNCLPDSLSINESSIVATDILTDGGVIHVIDTVLLPPEGDGMMMPTSKSSKGSKGAKGSVCRTGKGAKGGKSRRRRF